jgi:hypothetical protein
MKYPKKYLGPIIAVTIVGGLFAQQASAARTILNEWGNTRHNIGTNDVDHVVTQNGTFTAVNDSNLVIENDTSGPLNIKRTISVNSVHSPTSGKETLSFTSQKGASTQESSLNSTFKTFELSDTSQSSNIGGSSLVNMDTKNFAMDVESDYSRGNSTLKTAGKWAIINNEKSEHNTSSYSNINSRGYTAHSEDKTFNAAKFLVSILTKELPPMLELWLVSLSSNVLKVEFKLLSCVLAPF